jgi:hypothetical protein
MDVLLQHTKHMLGYAYAKEGDIAKVNAINQELARMSTGPPVRV